jgi:hypothetical protein
MKEREKRKGEYGTGGLFHLLVYLQLNKKKAKAEGKKCHAKTMWSQ